MAGLAIDVPRYFALRSRLQIAADAGAEAAARAVDIRHYINTGETRLEPGRYAGEAAWAFDTAMADLRAHGYTANLDGVDLETLGWKVYEEETDDPRIPPTANAG